MKEDRTQRLLAILQSADSWVPASTLAKMLGVSTRTIRTYIAQLADEHHIVSSQNGYRLAGQADIAPDTSARNISGGQADDAQTRVTTLLSMILSTHASAGPVSIYDAADKLCVSESTVTNAVLPAARELVSDFDLRLAAHDFQLSLEGEERDKRRLLRYLVTQHSYGYFTSTETLAQMFPDFDVEAIMHELVDICQKSDLFLNDYAYNNLLVHLLVISVRLETNHDTKGSDDLIDVHQLIANLRLHDQILHCADEIGRMLEKQCGIAVPAADFRQIVLLIALSCDQDTSDHSDRESITELVAPAFADAVRSIAQQTTDRYCLPVFDEDFLVQLTIHAYNAYQRSVFGVSCANPIAGQIKQSHPLVYDMAVYFSHRLERRFDIHLSEEERAFFAFHFGAYLANHVDNDDRVTCIVVAERYHDYDDRAIAAISDAFADQLALGPAMSYDEYLAKQPEADLVITTVRLPDKAAPHTVLISPVVGRHDLHLIRDELEAIRQERERSRARTFLRGLLHEDLFVRNLNCDSVDEYLDHLGALCIDKGYATRDFIEDVKLREHVSSTAFVDGLAVPHSINQFAIRSFVCVLHNDKPIPWGRTSVNAVLMFGLSKADIQRLGQTFDIIIDRFSSMESMRSVLESNSFEEFVTALTE